MNAFGKLLDEDDLGVALYIVGDDDPLFHDRLCGEGTFQQRVLGQRQ
ncbi:MAG: hypothetical protein ABI547_03820 [Betaproteobacteria bacterium]